MKLKAISFDCYGTLIDWESGIVQVLSEWARGHHASPSRGQLLAAFADAEPAVQSADPGMPYPQVLQHVAHRIGRKLELPVSDAEARSFAASIRPWPPFPDTRKALAQLQERYRLAVLSNVDNASFAATQEVLGIEFDLVCTAEEIGSYKPDARNFRFLLARLKKMGVARQELLHAAQSLFHDIEPARAAGIRTAWIDRYGGADSGATRAPKGRIQPDFTFASLAELLQTL